MKDRFHEAKAALNTAKTEFTAVQSLSVTGAYSVNQACENAIRGIWIVATGNPFPYDAFTPFHKPAVYIEKMNLSPHYSPETRAFLHRLNGYALDEARYEDTQAYRDYTNPKSVKKGKNLIEGAEKLINETIKLSEDQQVLRTIQSYERQLAEKQKDDASLEKGE